MNAVVIREMYPEDVPEVVKIERLSFSTPWSETSFYNEVYNRFCIAKVAELDRVIVGYVCVRRIVDEGHLHDLAVHPRYRRLGIAALLLDEALASLRGWGCRFFYLEVRASNHAARSLYERYDFRTVGTRKNYYAYPAEDAVIMVMDL